MAPPVPTRLDVRLHGGPAIGYPLTGEFLVGSAPGCDLRLPDATLPPVVCQFSLGSDGVRFRRRADTIIHHNGRPITDEPIALAAGETLGIGAVEITFVSPASTLLRPKLIPVDDATQQQAALDEQARELEEDRRIWYRRRQEMEAEIEELRKQAAGSGQQRDAQLQDRERAVSQREDELRKYEAELAAARHSLGHDYEAKRSDLTRLHEQVQRDTAELNARRSQLDDSHAASLRDAVAEIARRRQELESDLDQLEPRLAALRLEREQVAAAKAQLERDRTAILELRAAIASERNTLDTDREWQTEQLERQESDLASREHDLVRRESHLAGEKATLDAERLAHKEDLLRFDRWQGSLEERQTLLDARAAEIDERLQQLKRDAADLEDQLRIAATEDERLHSESERLDRLRADIETQAAKFAERSAQVEAQQAMLAVLRAKLDRQQEELRRDLEAFQEEKQHQEIVRVELENKLRDAELIRTELGFLEDDHVAKNRAMQEQQSIFSTTLEEFRHQKDEVLAAEAKLKDREQDLDERSNVIAEQAATLKAKLLQSLELQQRLEADRVAVREREAAMAEAEAARQTLQDQLRKRSEELNTRSRALDITAREIAEERAVIERGRGGIDEWRTKAESDIARLRGELESKSAEVESQIAGLVEREDAMARQVARMKEVGTAMAAERKSLFESRQSWEAEQSQTETFRSQVAEQVAELRRQVPEIEHQATAALEKLASAREVLRGQLTELHEFARQSRFALQAESEQMRQRELMLDQARSEHRVAVSEFRQQLHDWQAKVGDLKKSLKNQDFRNDDRQHELDAASERLKTLQADLARRTAEMEAEQRIANDKRNEMERHLADMREWYRAKLRQLAAGRPVDDTDMPSWDLEEKEEVRTKDEDVSGEEPEDARLGELLRSRGLIDGNALVALGNEARRQRKTLRQTLLASGVVTLYQLALIEAGNLDGLSLGRFRVVDRVRATPRESIYRVYDPERSHVPTVLRVLADNDGRDEYRERFKAATEANHPNLANVLDVLDVNGRPAALVEAVSGLPSSDWPALAATPGVWLRLMTDAARAVEHIHQNQLVHGRIAAENFLLTVDGTLKLLGLGEPGMGVALFDPLPAGDLRSLGRVAFGWSQIGAKRRVGKGKPFPAELAAVVRRLEAGAESGMGDIVSLDRPFADASELLRELEKLSFDHPCPAEAWNKLLASIGEESEPLRQSA